MVSGTDFIKNKLGRMSDPSADLQIALQLPTQIVPAERLLTAAEFHRLADVPPEFEWFANIRNVHTRRAYENAIGDFMRSPASGHRSSCTRSTSWTAARSRPSRVPTSYSDVWTQPKAAMR